MVRQIQLCLVVQILDFFWTCVSLFISNIHNLVIQLHHSSYGNGLLNWQVERHTYIDLNYERGTIAILQPNQQGLKLINKKDCINDSDGYSLPKLNKIVTAMTLQQSRMYYN